MYTIINRTPSHNGFSVKTIMRRIRRMIIDDLILSAIIRKMITIFGGWKDRWEIDDS